MRFALPFSAMRCDAAFSVHLFPWPLYCPYRQCGAAVLLHTPNFVGSRLLSSTFPVAVVLSFRQCGAAVLPYTSNFVDSRLLSSTFIVAVVLPLPSVRCRRTFAYFELCRFPSAFVDFSRGRCTAPIGSAVEWLGKKRLPARPLPKTKGTRYGIACLLCFYCIIAKSGFLPIFDFAPIFLQSTRNHRLRHFSVGLLVLLSALCDIRAI